MIALLTTSVNALVKYRERTEHVGRLYTPRMKTGIPRTQEEAFPWAADNDAFQGFKPGPFLQMLGNLAGLSGCKFVNSPDVVADWASTMILWEIYRPVIHDCDLPAAIVLQDGCDHIPADADAVFIGGTTHFKLSGQVRKLVAEAQERGLWVHMGRVNTKDRAYYARSIGCDSIDGSRWVRWIDTFREDLMAVLEDTWTPGDQMTPSMFGAS